MNILITGANGFVGRVLVRKLLTTNQLARLCLVDVAFDQPPQDGRVTQIVGSIADSGVLAAVWEMQFDLVFHLASVPGGAAEKNFELGLAVNLQASIALLEGLRHQAKPARLVFASTVAVYGSPLPPLVHDATRAAPLMSYGAHKLAVEVLIEDYSRRGWVEGISLRLPGIVARPPGRSGLLSSFMSEVFWHLAEGKAFTCPVSPAATAWWISV
jgi:nucleoside-diphosphate-sugar epimerase